MEYLLNGGFLVATSLLSFLGAGRLTAYGGVARYIVGLRYLTDVGH
jgi:hypothetical protein